MKVLVDCQDLDLVIIAAFRYALGRHTYMPSSIADFIKSNISLVPPNDVDLMIKEITQGEKREFGYSLGDEYNTKVWLGLRDFLLKHKELSS